MSWSAAQYSRFEDERNRPIRDLLAQVPDADVERAADIGCGPGNSTQLLQARFPGAEITGMDGSPDMIEAARKRLPGVRFEVDDIATWRGRAGGYDVVLSNAALQWVPDHAALLPHLLETLSPGGRLAVQMPDNLDEPAHRLMREVAADGPWAGKLADAANARAPRHSVDWYYRVLRERGASVNIWRTTYQHPMAGVGAIIEWFKGTGLRPFIQPLAADEQAAYLARYEAALADAHPAMADGTVLLPFPRLFFVATR